jgi:branched-chain amino acid aminotransferase
MWIDGRLCRGTEAAISLFDRGARDGEALFETMRVEAGRPRDWARHLERLVLSAAELGFPVPPSPATLARGVDQLLEAEGLADAVIRVTVTRGVPGGRPTRTGCWIDAEPLDARRWRGVRAGRASAVFSKAPFEPGPLGRHKTTSRLAYHLAREEARALRADEALLVSPAGLVLEGATSSVFVVTGGEARTPPLASGILPGITRAWALATCRTLGIPAREADISRDDALSADEVFLTNSVQGVVPLARLEERTLPATTVGERLRAAAATPRL